MKKKKILFIANYPLDSVPGQRFRFEQYFDYLEVHGFECTFSPLFNEKEIAILYRKGNFLKKFSAIFKGIFKRTRDVLRSSKYETVFIFREAFIAGPPVFEQLFRYLAKSIVYDFDDAIWIDNVSDANKSFSKLKFFRKIPKIISMADMVFAGNNYLSDYAKPFCSNVKIIPTTIDTEKYSVKTFSVNDGKVCIGWSGSITTIKHFELALPFLKVLKEKFGEKISFKVIGDGRYANDSLGITGISWSQETEVIDLSGIDVGIMPLPKDEWAKGKCGLKGLQYMALGIPTVMSPVGVNTEIIKDGENGFLASENQEWVDKISLLIQSNEVRKKLGQNGRNTVEKYYSYLSQRRVYLKYLNELTDKNFQHN